MDTPAAHHEEYCTDLTFLYNLSLTIKSLFQREDVCPRTQNANLLSQKKMLQYFAISEGYWSNFIGTSVINHKS